MRALALVDGFGVSSLRCVKRDPGRPGPGEALVKISAVSLNYRDLLIVDGVRPARLPLTPFSDGAGVVVETGVGVTRVKPGDRVTPTFAQGWISGRQPQVDSLPTLGGPLEGVCREMAIFHEDGLVLAPDHLSDVEAATLPCAGVSAWNALFEATRICPGQTVLVQGTGGVSLFALQFAKAAGARVILTSSSDEKLARGKKLGADEAINYRQHPDWGVRARAMTRDGVDCVVEIGGEATIVQSIAALRNGGHISYVGFVSGSAPKFDIGEMSRKSINLTGIRVGNRDSFERMLAAINHLGLRPVIDSVTPPSQVGEALGRMRAGRHFGKICLDLTGDWPNGK